MIDLSRSPTPQQFKDEAREVLMVQHDLQQVIDGLHNLARKHRGDDRVGPLLDRITDELAVQHERLFTVAERVLNQGKSVR